MKMPPPDALVFGREDALKLSHIEDTKDWLARLQELRKKCNIKRVPERPDIPPQVDYKRLLQRNSVIFQITTRRPTEKKKAVVGQFTYNHWKDATAERCAAFLTWAAKLGYTKKQLADMRAELLREPGSLKDASAD